MKKLLTILFLFSFWVNAQIQLNESYAFKPDKAKHAIISSVMSATIYPLVYHKTKDEGLAFRAAIILPVFPIIAKEAFDGFTGGEISLSDISYGLTSSLITSTTIYGLKKWRKKIKQKKIKKLSGNDNIVFALENEIFKK